MSLHMSRIVGNYLCALFALCVILLAGCGGRAMGPGTTHLNIDQSTGKTVVWTLDLQGLSTDERLTAACLQGLANRQGTLVYLNTRSTVRWMKWDDKKIPGITPEAYAAATQPMAKYESICDYWMGYLTEKKDFQFEIVTLAQLIAKLKPALSGVILYEKVSDDLSIAATMAGLRSAIPLQVKLYEKMREQLGPELPVIFDVRSLYAKWDPAKDRRIEAHRWMIEHLFPECDRSGALSRDRTYGLDEHDTLIDIDLAVKHRWAVFDLSYLSPETAESSRKLDPRFGNNPPDAELLVKILDGLKPFSAVYGWGRPGERSLVKRVSMQSRVFVCTGTANSSFYQGMPMFTKSLVQREPRNGAIHLENKVYVAFMVNEGDTLKYLASLGNGGWWLQQERGSLPINWGINPQLYECFPGLVSYYLSTATPNDYFFSATSGWGYVHPDSLPEASLKPYAALVRHGGEIGGLHYFDPWWTESLRKNGTFDAFIKATGMRGTTQWKGYQSVDFTPEATPVIYGNHYYTLKDPVDFSRRLNDEASTIQSPWFIVVYGGSPQMFSQVTQQLTPGRFKVVLLNEFFEAARQARAQVEGRKWNPAPPATRPVAPGDVLAPTN